MSVAGREPYFSCAMVNFCVRREGVTCCQVEVSDRISHFWGRQRAAMLDETHDGAHTITTFLVTTSTPIPSARRSPSVGFSLWFTSFCAGACALLSNAHQVPRLGRIPNQASPRWLDQHTRHTAPLPLLTEPSGLKRCHTGTVPPTYASLLRVSPRVWRGGRKWRKGGRAIEIYRPVAWQHRFDQERFFYRVDALRQSRNPAH